VAETIQFDKYRGGECVHFSACKEHIESTDRSCSKKSGNMLDGVIMLHDNVTPHTQPHRGHSPELAPSDFLPSGTLKLHLTGQRFVNDVTTAVTTWLQALDQDFFAKGFSTLVSRWDKCFSRGGDYVDR
jgi:hypothetical protein